MHFGLGVLRLSPRDYWAMTPRELAAAAGLKGKGAALTRTDFAELLNRYPDKDKCHE